MDKDKEKFVEIIEKNRGIIFKICNNYCKNPEDQKDLAQDITIELWKNFDKYDAKYKLTTWMYRIALNVAISSYRKQLTKKKYSTTLDLGFVHITQEETNNNEEELKMLKGFIDQLDEMNKALIILYLDSNSHKEIAEILNISTSNVGTKISRIKEKLKTYFLNLNVSK
jgi:RNA polymerase sigma-70 factor (ECF subfamily)